MKPRSCSLCGLPADVSVVLLVSTLRVSPRRQQSTTAIPLCNACLTAAAISDSSEVGRVVAQALTQACSVLTSQSNEQPNPPNPPSLSVAGESVGPESTSAVAHAASCRPCVTPCNSRQSDEAQKE